MKFRALQENLRNTLWERIDAGELTGMRLADETGFKQAHISNFLNRKRGLSLSGMDRVLDVQGLSVLDLLDPDEVNKRASILPPAEEDFANVAMVEGPAVAEPIVMSMNVKDILKFKKSFLRRLRSEIEGERDSWERFIVIRADAREGMSMYPRLLPGATLLVDRHYNALKSYRKGENNMYAVWRQGQLRLKYVEVANEQIILRPHNHAYPVEIFSPEYMKTVWDYIVGRICYVGIET
jgi:hypothetical protein